MIDVPCQEPLLLLLPLLLLACTALASGSNGDAAAAF